MDYRSEELDEDQMYEEDEERTEDINMCEIGKCPHYSEPNGVPTCSLLGVVKSK